MKNQAFTLIELLVVVLIIGILSAIALPQYTRAVEKSRTAEAMIMLGNMQRAVAAYVLANPVVTGGSALTFLGNSGNMHGTLDIDLESGLDCSVSSGKACASRYFTYSLYFQDEWYGLASRSNGDYSLRISSSAEAKTWTKLCIVNTTEGAKICNMLVADGFQKAI